MKEKRLSNLVQGMLEQHGSHVSMVESPEVSAGIPDLNVCTNCREVWIELKTVHAGEKAKIRPAQRRWTKTRVAAGGNVWWLCHQESTGLICLVHGRNASELSTFDTWRKLCEIMVTIESLDTLLPWLTGLISENQN